LLKFNRFHVFLHIGWKANHIRLTGILFSCSSNETPL